MKEDILTFYPKTKQEWRQWLIDHHQSEEAVWLLSYKKKTGKPCVAWSDVVDEALCFGWIDGMRKSVDEQSFVQFVCKRKPKSGWSKINKEKIERLIADGLMTEAGFKSIEVAKQNGSWKLLDEVEELTVPQELAKAFEANPKADAFFNTLSKSVKKMMLHWVVSAKRPETKLNRVTEIVENALEGKKPPRF